VTAPCSTLHPLPPHPRTPRSPPRGLHPQVPRLHLHVLPGARDQDLARQRRQAARRGGRPIRRQDLRAHRRRRGAPLPPPTSPTHLPRSPLLPPPRAPPRPPPAPTSRPLASSAPRPLATYLPTSYLLSNYRRAMRRRTNSSSSECSSSTPMVRPARRYVAVRVATNLVWPLDGQWLALDCAPLDLVLAWGCPRRPEFPTGALQFRCQVLDAAPGWGPSWWPWP